MDPSNFREGQDIEVLRGELQTWQRHTVTGVEHLDVVREDGTSREWIVWTLSGIGFHVEKLLAEGRIRLAIDGRQEVAL